MKDSKEKLKQKILEEEDYIYCPRLSNSVRKLMDRNQYGVDDDRLSKILLMSKKEINKHYNNAIKKIRKALNIEGD